ncbi:MAG: hypothetical protein ABSA11_06255 [Candidatus Bathyarchaeia archaeon]|jgi:hypothetical protein
MNKPRTDYVVEAASELGETYSESAGLLSGMNGVMSEVNQLYDHGYAGAGKSLVSFGITLVMIPEPFLVSDVIGCGIIAAGILYNKFVPPTLYIDNIFETIEEQVKAIHSTGEDLTQNYSIPLDFSSMHFEI